MKRMTRKKWFLPEADGWINFDVSIEPGEKLPATLWLSMLMGSKKAAERWEVGYFKEYKTKVHISARPKKETLQLDGLEIITT